MKLSKTDPNLHRQMLEDLALLLDTCTQAEVGLVVALIDRLWRTRRPSLETGERTEHQPDILSALATMVQQ